MNLSFLGRLATLTCAATMVLAVSCSNPASSSTSNSGGTGAAADTSKIGFESGYALTNVTADEANVKGGTMGMAFKLDTTQFNTGASSLNVTGTSQQNAYSSDFFGETKIALAATTDFTGKPISVAVYVPSGSAVSAVNLTLIDTTGKQTMYNQQNTTPGKWTTLTFHTGSDAGYSDPGAVITTVNAIRLRFETTSGSTAVSAQVNANVDSVNW